MYNYLKIYKILVKYILHYISIKYNIVAYVHFLLVYDACEHEYMCVCVCVSVCVCMRASVCVCVCLCMLYVSELHMRV